METRLIYHCRRCGFTTAQTISCDLTIRGQGYISYMSCHPDHEVARSIMDCPNCIHPRGWHYVIRANAVIGRVNTDIECSDDCRCATSAHCSCSCGGRNHGAAYEQTTNPHPRHCVSCDTDFVCHCSNASCQNDLCETGEAQGLHDFPDDRFQVDL